MLLPDGFRCQRHEFVSEGQADGEKRTSAGRVIAIIVFVATLLVGCQPVGVPAVAKLGLIAPFEGPSRSLGYSILYAVQLRIQQWNDTGGIPRVELVALNDNSDPSLVVQLPAQLALDPDVAAVLGPPQSHTAHAIVDSLARLEMPTLVLTPLSAQPQRPVIAFAGVVGQQQAPTPPVTLPPDFPAAYEALAGEPPTLQATLAYAATDELLRQLADHPDRQQLAQVLMTVGQP